MVTRTTSVQVDNNTIRITAEAERKAGVFTGNYGADITVTVPKNSSYISISTPWAATSRCPRCTADAVYMDTQGGKLNLNGGRYDIVYMNTAGGDIHASYEASNATLKTLGGQIEAETTQTTGSFYANTLGGNIDLDTQQTEGTIYANTMGGNVGSRCRRTRCSPSMPAPSAAASARLDPHEPDHGIPTGRWSARPRVAQAT